MYRESM